VGHWGGEKVGQERTSGPGKDWEMLVGEGVWSGGLRRPQGGAVRPERKTSSPTRRERRGHLRLAGSGGGRLPAAFAFALFQAVALAVHLQNMHVVGEPIQQRAGQPLRAQHLGPFLEG